MMGDAKDDPLSAERMQAASEWIDRMSTLPSIPPVRKCLRTVRAMADAHLAGGWRPIETLPACKVVHLGAWVGKPEDGPRHWARGEGHWWEWEGKREWTLGSGSSSYLKTYRPTHWQPITVPAPPPA